MTIPKTLAALPSSQYATLLDDVLGKLLDLPSPLAVSSAALALGGFDCARVGRRGSGCVDLHLTQCETAGRGAERGGAETTADRMGELRQGLQTKNRVERRGAAVRSWGKARKMEAMAGDAKWRQLEASRWWTTFMPETGGAKTLPCVTEPVA